jgi:acetolactate synthase-1/2/3 large subunit
MLPSAVATAVQYGLPAIWLVWNNGGFISIRDQQRGYFGQELTTSFRYAASGAPYRCDFAAMARAMGAGGWPPGTCRRSRIPSPASAGQTREH